MQRDRQTRFLGASPERVVVPVPVGPGALDRIGPDHHATRPAPDHPLQLGDRPVDIDDRYHRHGEQSLEVLRAVFLDPVVVTSAQALRNAGSAMRGIHRPHVGFRTSRGDIVLVHQSQPVHRVAARTREIVEASIHPVGIDELIHLSRLSRSTEEEELSIVSLEPVDGMRHALAEPRPAASAAIDRPARTRASRRR